MEQIQPESVENRSESDGKRLEVKINWDFPGLFFSGFVNFLTGKGWGEERAITGEVEKQSAALLLLRDG